MIIKRLITISVSAILSALVVSCSLIADYYKASMKKEAIEYFISKIAPISEKEALKREIDYYKEPQITKCETQELTGKDVIHAINELEKDKGQELFPRLNKENEITRILNYVAEHPNDIIGYYFNLSGVFTSVDTNQKYYSKDMRLICVRGKYNKLFSIVQLK